MTLSDSGDETTQFFSKDGTLIAVGYVRVVHGGRGDYIELDYRHIRHDAIMIPDRQRWRLSEKYAGVVFYEEFRPKDLSVKIYRQRKTVGYADYKVGMWYFSPSEVSFSS